MKEVSSSSDDDGFNTLPRNTLPNPIHLGQIADFWKRYENVADNYDRKISKHLNSNLDVLLIFAGLFSAIITAFLSFTLPTLSPDPTTETNALLRLLISGADNRTLAAFDQSDPFSPRPISLAINCLLIASLECSAFTAIGAMICKEWLDNLDRPAQTGSLEDRGRLRQRKFDEAKRWHVETIINSLPNMMVLSMGLFAMGISLFLLTINKMAAAFVITLWLCYGALIASSVVAFIFDPQCPYDSATSRTLKTCWRILVAWCTRFRGGRPAVAGVPTTGGALQSLLSLFRRSEAAPITASPHEGTLPIQSQLNYQDIANNSSPATNNKKAKKQDEQQLTNAQAAFWLLEMTPSREDQLIAVRFLYKAPRDACAAVITSAERRLLIIALTLEAFDIWRNQPDGNTQETAEHFGRTLCHVLPQTPERWRELTEPAQGLPLNLGRRFLRELDLLQQAPSPSDAVDEEFTLQTTLLRTLILTEDIPVDTYRWTSLKLLIRRDDEDCYLLWLWAKLVYRGFSHSLSYHIRQFPFASVPGGGRLSRRDVIDKDFPLALACGVPTLKSIERQAVSDSMPSLILDAVEIYTACIRKTSQLARAKRLFPPLQGIVADATTEMLTYFKKSTFLNPPEPRLIHFFISALQLLQSLHDSGHTPSLDAAALDGLWYALESIISAIDSSSETDGRAMDDLVLQTLETVSERLPVTNGAYSPMIGLEAHPRIMEYIAWRLVGEFKTSEGRAVRLMHKNRFRWLTQASSALRTAWMDAGLSSNLVEALQQPDACQGTVLLVHILEDITEMSTEWSRRLVADGFITSVADFILHLDQVQGGNPFRQRSIQCRLARALLSVWRHCSAITEIKWPKEKILLVIRSVSSATEWLLERRATQIDLDTSPSETLGEDVILDIRNKVAVLFDWTKERLSESAPITQDDTYAKSRLIIQQTDV